MKKFLLLVPIVFTVFLAGCASNSGTTSTSTAGKEHTVEITQTGFNPSSLAINSGDKVAFVNKDAAPHWPASAVHPTHCEYKGCSVFDSKKGLSQGKSYSIVFDAAGNWKYHDHLNPSLTGTVSVQ